MNEREAFEAWLLGSYGKVYSKEDCDRFVEHGHVSWLAWQARAAIEADRAQRVPDGWKQEAAEAIDWLLNNIRRDAPQLSGKAMGNAVRVRDALLASTPAPAQQERRPMTDEMEKVLRFLLGEDEIDGVWFGERHPVKKGPFWWRGNLRVAFHGIKE